MNDELEHLMGLVHGDGAGPAALPPADDPAAVYRRSDYLTATPRRLAEMLYDGILRLCELAIEALDDGRAELATDRLARARRIVRQLRQTAAPGGGAGPKQLRRLCDDVHRRLLEAEFYRRREAVREVVSVLVNRRPDWAAAVVGRTGNAHGDTLGDWVG